MLKTIIPEGASLAFADYFKLSADANDIVTHFGYTFAVKPCDVPHNELDGARRAP